MNSVFAEVVSTRCSTQHGRRKLEARRTRRRPGSRRSVAPQREPERVDDREARDEQHHGPRPGRAQESGELALGLRAVSQARWAGRRGGPRVSRGWRRRGTSVHPVSERVEASPSAWLIDCLRVDCPPADAARLDGQRHVRVGRVAGRTTASLSCSRSMVGERVDLADRQRGRRTARSLTGGRPSLMAS